MRVILFGIGSIGKKHARLLSIGYPEYELFAFRSGKGPANELGITELRSWNDVKRLRADVAFITNPTFRHIETALRCAQLGMHLFVEKPIGENTKGLAELMRLVKQRGLTAYVAYVLRFNPLIIELREELDGATVYHANVRCTSYLPEWRGGYDHLKGYSAYRRKGGGVILELSHEFDYTEYLFGKINDISGRSGGRGIVTVDAEAWADALVEHEGGHFTNLHINFMSRNGQRNIEADTDRGFFRADLAGGTLEHSDGSTRKKQKFKVDRDLMFVQQLRYFFDNIHNPGLMGNLGEAARLFKIITKFRRQATG